MWFGYNVDEKNGFPAGCPVGVDFTPLPMSAGVSSHIPEMCTRVELVRLRCPTLSQRGPWGGRVPCPTLHPELLGQAPANTPLN